MHNHMLITGLIGLFLALLWLSIGITNTVRLVERHNSNRLLVLSKGQAKLTIRWYVLIKAMLFVVGSVLVGYFI